MRSLAVLFESGLVVSVEYLSDAGKGQGVGFHRDPAHGAGFRCGRGWVRSGLKGRGLGEFFLGVLLNGGLVGFDAQHKVTTFFLRDELGGFFLAVERVGAEDAVQQVHRVGAQEC